MTAYSLGINGQTETGNLAWNADGTLGAMDIADNIPGTSDTQDCAYSHDDLDRLSEVNCAPLWQQTFSYDAFGNISASGSLAWQANDPANNRASLDSYDADGTVTSDGTYAYGSDADGSLISGAGTTGTYDAGDLRVQVGTGVEYLDGGPSPPPGFSGRLFGSRRRGGALIYKIGVQQRLQIPVQHALHVADL